MARVMNDSGIEWIGKIPEGWGTNTAFQIFTQVKNKNEGLKEQNLLSLSYGKIKRKSIETVGGLLPENFDGYNIIEADDIVLRLTDLQNDQKSLRVGISPERGIVTSAYLTLRNRSTSLPEYLYYYLHAFDISKGFYGMGAGVRQGLNWDGLKWLKILTPPVPEQEKIVSFLDAECARIDAVIEQTRASIEEYKKLKQSVITEAVTKGIRPGRKMKDSGVEWIGEIPEEWHIDKIAKVASFHNGDRSSNYPSGDDIVDEGILFVTSNNLGNIILNTNISSNKYITQEKYAAMRGAKLRINDIVFCLRGSVGKCSINKSFSEGTIASSLVVIRPESIDPDFLNYALQNPQITELAMLEAIGIGSQNLAAADIAGFKIPIPSEEDSESIVAYLKEKTLMIEELIQKKLEVLTELDSCKKSLIFEYVTGKKEVV